jgi:hypothetical protein
LRHGGEKGITKNQELPTAERAKGAKVNEPGTDVAARLCVLGGEKKA